MTDDKTTAEASTIDDIGGDDLTKEELGLRLKEVRDYYRETDEMSQENVCLSLFRTRLPKLRLNRCFVAESTVSGGGGAGRGLFASRDIEEGTLLTLYPGDVMLTWDTAVGDFSGDVGVVYGNHVEKEDRTADRLTTDGARSYELKIGGRHSVVADPLLVDDAAYLGHMVNDAAMLTGRDEAAVEVYVEASERGHNAAHFVLEGSHFVTVATKNISKDQEIFVSYGYGYWFSRSRQQNETSTSIETASTVSSSSSSSGTVNSSSQSERVTKKGMKRTTKRSGTKKGFGKK